MAIYNPDGTPYQPKGSLQQFDPQGSAHDLFNRFNREIIEIGGSPVFYYEMFVGSQDIDHLFIEARNKMWSQHPVEFMAMYDPASPTMAMTMYGPDAGNNAMVFYTNYQHFLDKIGHPPVIGSRIHTPQLRENWKIMDRRTSGYQNWGVVTLEIHCVRFQESLTTGEGKVSQDSTPKYDII